MARGQNPVIGGTAPDFRLESLAGEVETLETVTAHGPALLVFYKVSCPTCQLTLPYLGRLAGSGLQVYAICQNDAESASEFNQEYEVALPTLLDAAAAGYPASNAYGITHVPTLFLINPDRSIAWNSVGFLKKDLESLGQRFGVTLFGPADRVPDWKGG